MKRACSLIAGLALAVFALGVAVLPLQAPAFTRILCARVSLVQEAGLPRGQMARLAEQTRAFVVAGKGELPARVASRPGFGADAVGHLADVRDVLAGGRTLTGVLAVALVAFGVAVRRRPSWLASALRTGAVLTLALPLIVGAWGVADFDGFFAAFHGLFFASGTWVFPADSLLTQLFPEPFWIVGGIAWAVLVIVASAAYGILGFVIERTGTHGRG